MFNVINAEIILSSPSHNQYNGTTSVSRLNVNLLWYYLPTWYNVSASICFHQSWFVNKYFPLNFNPIKQKWIILRIYWIMFHVKVFKHMSRFICWRLKWEDILLFQFQTSFLPFFSKNMTNLIAKSGSPFSDYYIMIYASSCIFTRNKLWPSNIFETNVIKVGGNSEFILLPIENI